MCKAWPMCLKNIRSNSLNPAKFCENKNNNLEAVQRSAIEKISWSANEPYRYAHNACGKEIGGLYPIKVHIYIAHAYGR
ncbi:11621_t:CDS:2 [Ambispora leptoticha]|uniref:11621_t:CDS:1 n=1 Tax=Ambispora leptoticha TaxID=144679 RepID=A0A9N8W7K9_9GLOM|nr:11621_t:CDS:2 [Ambispora leptoticha]